jgi:hypothetical protein
MGRITGKKGIEHDLQLGKHILPLVMPYIKLIKLAASQSCQVSLLKAMKRLKNFDKLLICCSHILHAGLRIKKTK